jgi:hypothetical protein
MIKDLTKSLIEASKKILEGPIQVKVDDRDYVMNVGQMALVQYILKKTKKKVYFDGLSMVADKDDSTIHMLNPKRDKVGDLVKIAKKKA